VEEHCTEKLEVEQHGVDKPAVEQQHGVEEPAMEQHGVDEPAVEQQHGVEELDVEQHHLVAFSWSCVVPFLLPSAVSKA